MTDTQVVFSDWIFQNGISQNIGKCEHGEFSKSQSQSLNILAKYRHWHTNEHANNMIT